MAGGRPTKLSKEVQDKIVSAIKLGNYIETASAFAGINKSTLYDWLKRGAREEARRMNGEKADRKETKYVQFSNAIEKAMAESEVRDVGLIGQAAKENWQAAAWRLERKYPDRWARRSSSLDKELARASLDHRLKQAELLELKVKLMKGDEGDTALMKTLLDVLKGDGEDE